MYTIHAENKTVNGRQISAMQTAVAASIGLTFPLKKRKEKTRAALIKIVWEPLI